MGRLQLGWALGCALFLSALACGRPLIDGDYKGATAVRLRFRALPSSMAQGASARVWVAAVDVRGNPVKSYRGTVHFGSTDANATLPADDAFVVADAGEHAVTVTFRTLGEQTLRATAVAAGGLPAAEGNVMVVLPTCQPFGADGPLAQDGNAPSTALARGSDGTPWLAWRRPGGATPTIALQRWDAAAGWQAQTLAAAPGAVFAPQLSLDVTDQPTVAWLDVSGNAGDAVLVESPGRNHGVTAPPGASGILENSTTIRTALAMGPADGSGHGKPYIAWDSSADQTVHVRAWNGSAWTGLTAGTDRVASAARRPALAVNAQGVVYVAWTSVNNSTGISQIHLAFWNGAWVGLGSSLGGGGVSQTTSTGDADHVTLAIGPSGRPALAWDDYRNTFGYNVYYAEWTGNAWAALAGSSSGDGVSGNPQDDATQPSLAMASDGSPLVAWTQVAGGTTQIYLRRFNGTAWEEIGTSASAGGVSAAGTGAANWPRLVLDGSDVPLLAWETKAGAAAGYHVCAWR